MPTKRKPKSKDALTLKQRLWVEAYLGKANGNATEAARIAGFGQPRQAGSRMLSNVVIRALVEKRVVEAAMSADEVLQRVTGIAGADIGSFITIDKKGSWVVDLRKGKGQTNLVRKLRFDKYGPVIELQDPFRAVKLLGEFHGLWRGQKADKIDLEAVAREMMAKRDKLSNRNTGGSP